MNVLILIKNAVPVFITALSLATATATTTDVIFSFEEDEGEYADTDLETDNAGNIYGTTVLGGEFGGGQFFNSAPHLVDGSTAALQFHRRRGWRRAVQRRHNRSTRQPVRHRSYWRFR